MHYQRRRFEDDGAAPTSTALLEAPCMMLQPAYQLATTSVSLCYHSSPVLIFCYNHANYLLQPASRYANTYHWHRFFCYNIVAFLLQPALPFATKNHRQRRKSCDRRYLVFARTGGVFCCNGRVLRRDGDGYSFFCRNDEGGCDGEYSMLRMHRRRRGGLRR